MKRCKHENAEHLMPGECVATMDGIVFVVPAIAEQFRCLDCRAWLSLGPANDEPDAVRIETRAAELALDLTTQSALEWAGWVSHKEGYDVSTFDGHAGYLARCIATHDAAVRPQGLE